jgi:hypothetical protein
MTSRSALCFGCVEQPRDVGSALGPAPSWSEAPATQRRGGRLRVHLCRKSTLVAADAGRVLAPLSSRLPVSARCACPRFHVAPRSTRSAAEGPPAPSQRGAGRGCGAGGTSDSALLARRLHGAQCHSAERAARTVRRGPPALAKRCPRNLSLSQSQATDHPSPRPRGHLAAVNAETMDAGAAPQKHSRCRSCCCRRRAGAGRRAGAPLLLARVGAVLREGALAVPEPHAGAQLLLLAVWARVRMWNRSRTGREVQGSLGGLRYWMRDPRATPCKLSSPGFRMSSWVCNSVWRLTPAGVGVGTPLLRWCSRTTAT